MTDEPGRNTASVHTTGTKKATGCGSYAVENAVIGGTHSAPPPWARPDAKEVHTGDKIADDGGKAFENAVFNGIPE